MILKSPARAAHLALVILILACAACAPSTASSPTPTSQPANRPNILLIISDDQRYDTMNYMPLTQERIFNQGVTFTNAYVTTPLCCPSRAAIFTGMYDRNNGVHVNGSRLIWKTFMERLHDAGYYSGMVGKYLNSWDNSVRPEFNSWVAFERHADQDHPNWPYTDPLMNINGDWGIHQGYLDFLLRDYALQFLNQAVQQPQPFLLIYATHAPHAPYVPAPGDATLYPDLAPLRPPSFNEADVSDKPGWVQALPLLDDRFIAAIDLTVRLQIQMLHGLDEEVDSLLTALDQAGKLDNTIVIYLSDNGYEWGEHRLTPDKSRVYEESVRVPFAIRYPPLLSQPHQDTHLVANIDIAPTIFQLAGLPIPANVDGRSLVPLLQGQSDWRDSLFLEGWLRNPFFAIHTEQYVYVETNNDSPELYDLTSDPYELQNQVNNSDYASVVADLSSRLAQARAVPLPTPGPEDLSTVTPSPDFTPSAAE